MRRVAFNVMTSKIGVDNRISLRNYYRIADTLLKQANIYREEKILIDLYVILLRYSSLVSETIPYHRDYQALCLKERTFYKKKLFDVLDELEQLKPQVRQWLDELDEANTTTQMNQTDGPNKISYAFSVNNKASLSYSNVQNNMYAGVSSSNSIDSQLQKLFDQKMIKAKEMERSQTPQCHVRNTRKNRKNHKGHSSEDAREKGKFLNSNSNVDINSLPFPQRAKQLQLDTPFSKFLEIFKKLHINIPFAEALAQMPSYAKFLKEILSNKRKLVDFETVKLSEECSAILQNKLPPKLKDPGSFSIPCTIGSSFFSKALCDLGASINLMPYSCFEKLGIGEVKPTTISLQLADRSIKYPRGVVEDVLVKVDKFIFPVDFVVLDMEEDREIPLILRRPFLATGKALIDVHKGELVLRLNDESVVFNVFQSIKYPNDTFGCFRIDATDEFVECGLQGLICEDPLEICLTHICPGELENGEIEECIHYLDAGRPISKTVNSRIGELGHIPRPLKSSIEEAPILEMKPLPSHLKYMFLLDNDRLPVIVPLL